MYVSTIYRNTFVMPIKVSKLMNIQLHEHCTVNMVDFVACKFHNFAPIHWSLCFFQVQNMDSTPTQPSKRRQGQSPSHLKCQKCHQKQIADEKENIPPSTPSQKRNFLVRTSPVSKDFETVVGASRSAFNASKLPTNRAILQRFRDMRLKDKQVSRYDIAKSIYTEVVYIWQIANILTQRDIHCVENILKVIN